MEDRKLIEVLSEELRETKVIARAAEKHAEAAMLQANASMKKADAAWELVVMTRNQINRPWWKRVLGFSS